MSSLCDFQFSDSLGKLPLGIGDDVEMSFHSTRVIMGDLLHSLSYEQHNLT